MVLLERAPTFRTGGQNVDVRGPGREALVRMGLLDAIKARNTTEQAWTFVNADNSLVARFDKDDFGGDGPTAELEILRGDLACILDGATEGVEHRYGDRITALDDDGTGVDVTFGQGGTERFDLIVAAEGVGSSTRRLVWGEAARIKPFGLSSGYFSISKGPNDGEDARWFDSPGGRSVFLRPDPKGTTRVVLSLQRDTPEWDDLPADEAEADPHQLLRRRGLGDAGWETRAGKRRACWRVCRQPRISTSTPSGWSKPTEAVEKGCLAEGLVAMDSGAAVRTSDPLQAGTVCLASNWRLYAAATMLNSSAAPARPRSLSDLSFRLRFRCPKTRSIRFRRCFA